MRKAAIAGLFACACVFTYSPKANAEAFELFNKDNSFQNVVTTPVLAAVEPIDAATVKPEQETVKKVQPEVTKHTVVEGESLDSIARLYNTTWKRLYNKNESISDPDMIEVADEITIPAKDEKLKKRELTQVQAEAGVNTANSRAAASNEHSEPVQQGSTATRTAPVSRSHVRSSAGNTYTPGQCTWHVKNMRGSSLPNGLGNANEWIGRARAMGLATGSTPRVGAAAVRTYGNHVAYVTAVHGNGTITVSEMNYNWTPYATRSAVKPASDYLYIY